MAAYRLAQCQVCGRMMRIPFAVGHTGDVVMHTHCAEEIEGVWKNGRQAARTGQDISDNPHASDPHKWAWVRGFMAGREEDPMEQNSSLLNGTFDNEDTQQREYYVNGQCVSGVHRGEIEQGSGSAKYIEPWGYYANVPGAATPRKPMSKLVPPAQTVKADSAAEYQRLIIDALSAWYGDGKHQPSEESTKAELAREDDPIAVIAQALIHHIPGRTFKDVTDPVIHWLRENSNPHAIVVVDPDGAVLYIGETTNPNPQFPLED